MSHIEMYRCDECGKNLDNCECSSNQCRFTFVEMYDFGGQFHFCGIECLKKFINKPQKEWKHKIKPEEIPYGRTLGDSWGSWKGNGSDEGLRAEKE